MNRGDKSGQMQISFGMIFSIILIIAFIAFAVYAIYLFLDTKKIIDVGTFRTNLQNDVNVIWRSDHGSQTVTYSLPSEVKKVCFINTDEENLIFLPPESTNANYVNITHLDIIKTIEEAKKPPLKSETITEYNNEEGLCFVNDGKVSMTLVKEYGEAQVYVKK